MSVPLLIFRYTCLQCDAGPQEIIGGTVVYNERLDLAEGRLACGHRHLVGDGWNMFPTDGCFYRDTSGELVRYYRGIERKGE
jgi:hypothetical protein